jgi:uncharacterized protein YfaS (alpha-2-macroglobulin family)
MSVHHSFPNGEAPMSDRPSVTVSGKVEKIIQSLTPRMSEKAQITIQGAEELYREIRIENKLMNKNGDEVRLKQGAEVKVTIEVDEDATTPRQLGN